MKKWTGVFKTSAFLLIILLSATYFLHTQNGYAKTKCVEIEGDKTYESNELSDLIEACENKIDDLNGQKNSLLQEIEYFDSQINLTNLRIRNSQTNIQEKKDQIAKLVTDIEDLSKRIDKLVDSIKYQETVLHERIRERYKNVEDSPVMVLFGSETLNKLVQKSEYLKIMEVQDRKLMVEMNQTKDAFNTQKMLFEKSKEKEESLKVQLEQELANLQVYEDRLADQKAERARLLQITQNDEAKYQKLLDEAKRELNQILGAVTVLKGTEGVDVKQGDIIGTQGNTGNSSGDHLHFGVYKYSSFADIDGWNWYYSNYVDPSKKLKKKTVYWNDGCSSAGNKSTGSGDWAWPLSSPTISQGFGKTCWSNIYYGGNPHPAYDMYGAYNSPVYAVDDGKAYSCRNCLGDGGNGVFIFHKGGYMTLYWHLK